jgi:hypothetical protein
LAQDDEQKRGSVNITKQSNAHFHLMQHTNWLLVTLVAGQLSKIFVPEHGFRNFFTNIQRPHQYTDGIR